MRNSTSMAKKAAKQKFDLPVDETLADLAAQKERGRTRLALVRGASMGQLVAVEERRERLPGVRVTSRSRRRYLHGALFSHVIGYTGEVDPEDLATAAPVLDYRLGDYEQCKPQILHPEARV